MTGLTDLAAAARRAAASGPDTDRSADGRPEKATTPGRAPARDRAAGRAPRIGLVLSGGGAKGAYHVGVVEYLASVGTRVHAIAGASIGALNGAILAAAGSPAEGAAALAAVWEEVAWQAGSARPADGADGPPPEETTWEQLARLLPRLAAPALHPAALEQLVADHIDPDRLGSGIPLWVSAFPALEEIDSLRGWSWTLDVVRSGLGARAEWLHVNDLPRQERHRAVLASAALPVVLPPRRVGPRLYRDGGMADNTPAGALARYAGCDIVIVVHLSDGALWDAHDHPTLRVIEIRPRHRIRPPGPAGGATALVDLSPKRLAHLRGQGFEDARWTMEPLRAALSEVEGARTAQSRMLGAVAGLDDEAQEPGRPPDLRG
ncbi:patatin-like phospholipase family protein [Streptomyces spororaveus]|uniref:patatin-like phospholipase family protein n=1 Tax=Streptomyces spororaveus TaxID=284039 RepID=UPI00207953D2|nr:patatin-like phospholipase family protein [Streptomyces spororaveus]MCM9082910.1 patatin-like phospholipase family protein [Streptomyces spororaveus]